MTGRVGRLVLGRGQGGHARAPAHTTAALARAVKGARGTADADAPNPKLPPSLQATYPNLLARFDAFASAAAGKRIAVFLDYDGTLTPIVRDPDAALLSARARAAVRALACLFPTAIVSGRARDKVEAFVQLPELYYAGSHGMDIVGPREKWGDGESTAAGDAAGDASTPTLAFCPAQDWAPIMDALHARLAAGVAPVPGASVEHNTFCVSVHYRNVARSQWDDVATIVSDAVAATPGVRASRGRKVLEIKPEINWDKGAALSHLLDALGLGSEGNNGDVLPLYIGDDTTDEDAFKLLARRGGRSVVDGDDDAAPPSSSTPPLTDADRVRGGVGVLVTSRPKPSAASYSLRDPGEVLVFLSRLAAWGASPASGWHAAGGCTGWTLRAADARVCELPAAAGPPSPSGSTGGDGVSPAAGRPPRPPADRRGGVTTSRPASSASGATTTATPSAAAGVASPLGGGRAASDATSAPAAAAAAAAAALGSAPR